MVVCNGGVRVGQNGTTYLLGLLKNLGLNAPQVLWFGLKLNSRYDFIVSRIIPIFNENIQLILMSVFYLIF